MKISLKSFATATLLFMAVMTVSCKKETSSNNGNVTQDEAAQMSEENAAADAEYDDVTEIGMSTGADIESISAQNGEPLLSPNGGAGLRFRLELFADLRFKVGPCTTLEVTPDDSTFPKTVTINYGEGCVCFDGKFRKGSIEMTFSAPLHRPGSVLTITLHDYFVNRAHIEGTKTITNLSENGIFRFGVTVENGKIFWPNGRGFEYNSSKVITLIDGSATLSVRDDVYSLEGRSTTAYANGVTVTKNTESALIKPVACAWVVKGVLNISVNDRKFSIDFGDGTCDNKALLTWANGQREIKLP